MELRTSTIGNCLGGALFAVVGSFFWGLLFAFVFRLPIPLAGTYGPFGEFDTSDMDVTAVVFSVFTAWMFYGILGGFIVLSVLGLVTGLVVGEKYRNSPQRHSMIVLWPALVGGIPVFLLSILDLVIGPW